MASEFARPADDGPNWLAWRRGISVVLCIDVFATIALTMVQSRRHTQWLDAPGVLGGLAVSNPSLIALGVLALLCAVQFGRASAGYVWGLGYLVVLWLLDHAVAAVHGGFGTFGCFAGSALLGWLVGRVVARSLGWDSRRSAGELAGTESLAARCAIALFSATYVCAAVSKLGDGGLAWLDPDNMRLIVQGRVEDGPDFLYTLRTAFVSSPLAAGVATWGTLVLELGAPLMLLGKRPRALVTAGLVAMHVGILALLGIFFAQAIACCIVFGVPWRRRCAAAANAAIPPVPQARLRRAELLVVAASAVILGSLWLAPIEPQRDPFDVVRPSPMVPGAPAPSPPPPSGPPTR
ncbi:MAG: hypothetical protein R3F39_10310 [Myxococcota bacterium]